jgi:formylglycine-generating enzyme required for sulfatase activity
VKELTQFKEGNVVLANSWYENGQKKREVNYKDGKQDGLATWWNKDGVKSSIPAINRSKVRSIEEVIEGIDSLLGDIKMSSRVIFKPGENFTVPDLGLEMIWVKHGAFMMGSPKGEAKRNEDEIQHQVTLTKGFYLGKYEVTQAQWVRVMGNNPSNFKGADRPVEEVSWNDAVVFCKKLTEMEKKAGRVPQGMSYQLLTEAQWEYACRAGTSTMYSWGDSISSSNANYGENVDETTPVGKYPANPWGFHDMHGNVWEWCADWSGDYPSGSVTNPIGPASGEFRVVRGGSWNDDGASLRSAERYDFPPSHRFYDLGFRVGFQSSK